LIPRCNTRSLEFDDALDDDAPNSPEGDEPGRAVRGQSSDEATAGDSAGVTEESDAAAAEALLSVAVPDR